MATLSVNEIATLIYWVGEFGPQSALHIPTYSNAAGTHATTQIPKPGSPARTKIENWLDTAIAVCLAESGGNTTAKNPASSASGLWQIMVSVHGPEISKAVAQISAWDKEGASAPTGANPPKGSLDIWDPRVNTYTAAEVYRAANFSWSPWSTYTSGDYKKFKGHGKEAYAFLTNPAHITAAQKHIMDVTKNDHVIGGLGPISVPSWLQPIFDWAAKAGITIGVFLLGLIVLLLGLWVAIRKTPAGKTMKTAVAAVATDGVSLAASGASKVAKK